jgi:hypothetical protein
MLSAIMGCSLWKDLIRDNNADQAEQHADRDNEPVTRAHDRSSCLFGIGLSARVSGFTSLDASGAADPFDAISNVLPDADAGAVSID